MSGWRPWHCACQWTGHRTFEEANCRIEICDYQDNDPDGLVDEGFNFESLCPISCFDPDLGPYRGNRVCSPNGLGTVWECE